MKPFSIAAAFASILAVTAAQASSAKVGEQAPNFTLTDSQGVQHSLTDFKGKTVVLEWTNHECPFVKKHYDADNMQSQQRAATEAGVVWLTINSSAQDKQGHVDATTANRLRTEAKAANTAYLFDTLGDTGRAYAAKTTPHMYVIDTAGVIRYAGAIDSIASADTSDIVKAEQYIPAALSALAANQPITTTVSQPYGCSIKY